MRKDLLYLFVHFFLRLWSFLRVFFTKSRKQWYVGVVVYARIDGAIKVDKGLPPPLGRFDSSSLPSLIQKLKGFVNKFYVA